MSGLGDMDLSPHLRYLGRKECHTYNAGARVTPPTLKRAEEPKIVEDVTKIQVRPQSETSGSI